MKGSIRRNMLLHFAVLFKLFQINYCQSRAAQSYASNRSIFVPWATVRYGSYSMVNVTMISTSSVMQKTGFSTKITMVPSPATTSVTETSYHPQNTTTLIYWSSTTVIQPTSAKSFVYSTHFSPKTHSTLPHTPTPTTPHPQTSKGQDKPILHKVGLIVGIVVGMVILSVCLIVFHKKEARIKCLKLLCKPCTKNYSRYNIVPIYVYDDNEQDIRELQDDSDLPLV